MNLENYSILHRHRLFGQTTKEPLKNFEPKKPWKYKQFWALRPDPSVRKIKVELLKEYVMILKVVCKDRASRNGMQ